jgi:hypothetical protein
MTTDQPQGLLPIPGFDESRATVAARNSPLVKAVRSTIDELAKEGHISPVDVGKVALAMELADVIALKRSTGRMSTLGNDARVLMEILDSFVAEVDQDGDELLRGAMEEWSARVDALGLPQAPTAESA